MTKRTRKPQSQPRIQGLTRIPTHAAIMPEVEDRVLQDAHHYGVSKSWVRAVIIAEYYGIDIPSYKPKRRKSA